MPQEPTTTVTLKDGRKVVFKGQLSSDEVSQRLDEIESGETTLPTTVSSEPPELVQRMASLAMKAKRSLPMPLGGEDEIAMPVPGTGLRAKPIHLATQLGIGAVETGEFFKSLPGMILAGIREGKAPPQTLIEQLVAEPAKEQFGKAKEAFGQKRYVEAGGQALGALPLLGPPSAALAEQAGTGDVSGAFARGIGQVGTGAGLFKGGAKLAARPVKASPLSEPFAKVKPQIEAVMHDRSLAVREHVSQIGEAFKREAQKKIDAASKAADAANPAGIPKQAVQDGIRADLGEVVKVPEKIPVSLQKILAGPTLEQATVFRGQGAQGRGIFSPPGTTNLAELPVVVQQQIRARLNLPEVEAQRPIPTGGYWTHEQLKQLRTDLGSELFGKTRASMAPAVRKAATNAYQRITSALQENASAAGAKNGALWADGVGQFRKYMEDFERSPVRRILSGKTATDITEPLRGKAAEQVRRILRQYGDYGYKEGAVRQEISLVQRGKDAIQRGKLTKFDLGILSATAAGLLLHPGSLLGLAYEAGRIGIPKIQQRILARSGAKRGAIPTTARTEAILKQLAEERAKERAQ